MLKETLVEIGLSLLLTYAVVVVGAGVFIAAIHIPAYSAALVLASASLFAYEAFRKS